MSTPILPNQNKSKIIHAASYQNHLGNHFLILRQKNPNLYSWYELDGNLEKETNIFANTAEEAIRLASNQFMKFKPLLCGFLYTLPERDEHGINALLYQMIASYKSPTGIYYDEERGHNCFVDNAPQSALKFWKQLEQAGKL